MGGVEKFDILISDLLCSSCKNELSTDVVESVTSYIKFDVTVDKPDATAPLTLTLDVEKINWKKAKSGYYHAEALVRIDCPNCDKPHEIRRYIDAPLIVLSEIGYCRQCNSKLEIRHEEIELADHGPEYHIIVRAEMSCRTCFHSEEQKRQLAVPDFNNLLERGRIVLDFSREQISVDDNAKIRILFLSANPSNTGSPPLSLINEYKDISKELKLSMERDAFDCIQAHGVSLSELQGLLLEHAPQIVHFSGHGSESGQLVFETPEGLMEFASELAVARLLEILGDGIKCVLLNACYSDIQAAAIAEKIDCVIGMSSEISDGAARTFGLSFYRALGHRKSIKAAFDLACNQLDLANIPEAHIPKLMHKAHVDPAQIFVLRD